MNNTTQAANNATTSQVADTLAAIPDLRGILSSVESALEDKLIDWGQDPFHTMCLMSLLFVFAFLINCGTSNATKKLQGGNKWLLYLIVFLGILWWLEVL